MNVMNMETIWSLWVSAKPALLHWEKYSRTKKDSFLLFMTIFAVLIIALPSSYVLVIYQAVLLRTTLFMAPLDGSHHPSKSLLLYQIMVTLEIMIFFRISSGTRILYIWKWTDEKKTVHTFQDNTQIFFCFVCLSYLLLQQWWWWALTKQQVMSTLHTLWCYSHTRYEH